jgi:hypothetical protein
VIVSRIVRNVLRKEFPGLKRTDVAVTKIAVAIHARMYGAHVDGVDSPIWRDTVQSKTNPNGSCSKYNAPPNQPKVDASELLKKE